MSATDGKDMVLMVMKTASPNLSKMRFKRLHHIKKYGYSGPQRLPRDRWSSFAIAHYWLRPHQIEESTSERRNEAIDVIEVLNSSNLSTR